MSKKLPIFMLCSCLIFAVIGLSATFAMSSATFVFDFSDLGDLGDGPDYIITAIDPIDDGGGCDAAVMIMVDATGTLTDIDNVCMDLLSGLGGSDGDYGSTASGYVPLVSPVTYALFDLDAADLAAMSAMDEQAAYEYVIANKACIYELFLDETGLPTDSPYSFCGAGLAPDGSCRLNIPEGSVVGEAPLGAQAFYEPGNASNFSLNPGTYIVIGQDESESYYKIVLACQTLWVLKESMQPSYLLPQNGTPLPTRIVS